MQLVGRNYSSSTYRYGFNGQEKSTELNDNLYTAEYWEYDSRIGRRWNVDPMPAVDLSQYATFANNPIWYTDVRGDTVEGSAGGGFVNVPNGSRVEYNQKSKDGKPFSERLENNSNISISITPGSVRAFTTPGGVRYIASYNSKTGEFLGYHSMVNFQDEMKEIESLSFLFNMSLGTVAGKTMGVGFINTIAHYKDGSYDVIYSYDARSGGHGFGPLPSGNPGEENAGKWLVSRHIWNRFQKGYYITKGSSKVGFSMLC